MTPQTKDLNTPGTGNLTGLAWVRVFRPAFDDAVALCPRARDRVELRSHALKRRYWPHQNLDDGSGTLMDLDWSWIESLKGLNIGELRIADEIGGNDNLRIIFFRGEPVGTIPMSVMWVLAVMQKRSMDFSRHNIEIFRARRVLVVERFYRHRVG